MANLGGAAPRPTEYSRTFGTQPPDPGGSAARYVCEARAKRGGEEEHISSETLVDRVLPVPAGKGGILLQGCVYGCVLESSFLA